jgi:putative tricarboxylic transport membrane protein
MSWWGMLRAFLKKGDVISGAVLAALGVYIITQAHTWDYYTLDGPGPGFFPFWYGVAMVVLSLLLVLNAARTDSDSESKAGVDWPATGRAMTVWLAFALSVGLMEFLGFLISFALLAFFLVAVVFRRPFVTATVVAVVSALAFHLIFPVALSVSLPTGPFGF